MNSESFDEIKSKFLKSFVHGFVLGWDKTRIGILLYSENTRYVAPMSTYTERSKLFERIQSLKFVLNVLQTRKKTVLK